MNIHLFHRITAAPKTLAPGQPNCLYHRLGRRFLAAWILPLLLLLALPEAVQAQFTFTTNNGAITITGYTGPGGAVDIPSTINGLPVTSIGNGAFHSCTSLTGVYFRGNAPSLAWSVFSRATNATVYYLPGTYGWGSTFSARPTQLWNPLMQASGSSFGVRANRFGFNITGTTNIPIVVEACTNLAVASWVALQNCTLTNGSLYFSDPNWTNYPTRLYHIRSP